MDRCRQCEASMTKDENTCISCGTSKVPPPKKDFKTRGRTVIHYFFLLSAAMTVMSLVTPWGPPFMMSVCVTLVLLLVKSSWNEMLAGREEQ